MRAALLEEPGKGLNIVTDVDIADPQAGQVRVKISHCGFCHSDLSVIDGAFPAPLPILLGHEAAGVIDAVGSGVRSVFLGDSVVVTPCPPCGTCYWCVRAEAQLCENSNAIITNVFSDGSTGLSRGGETVYRGLGVAAFGEYVLTQATGAVVIDEDVPREVACVLGCAVQTGVGAVLNTAGVEEGATVLVTGLGGVGQSVVQGARAAGAAKIIVSDPIAARREAAARMGATDLLDPATDDVPQAVLDLTGVGVDYAFEAAGRSSLIQLGIQVTRKGGTTVIVGAPRLDDALEIPTPSVFLIQEKKLIASVLGSSNSLRDIPRFIALWRAGRLDLEALITARRPLEKINAAADDMRSGRGIRTVLEM